MKQKNINKEMEISRTGKFAIKEIMSLSGETFLVKVLMVCPRSSFITL